MGNDPKKKGKKKMKRMKKILAMVMAMAMVLGMSLTTFAADVKITLKNMENAQKIEYAQVIVADQTAESGWNFVSNEVATAYAKAFGLITETQSVDMSTEAGSAIAQTALWKMVCYEANYNKKVVANLPEGMNQKNDAVTEDEIRKALGNASNSLTYITLYQQQKDEGGNVTNPDVPNAITVSEAGIYAVKAEEEGYTYQVMAGYVGFGTVDPNGTYPTLQNAEITAKKSETTTPKEVTDPDKVVAIGDVIEYSITAYVPYINPANVNKSFTITDTIKGADYYLTGADSVATIEMDGEEVVGATFDVTVEGDGFTIDLSNLINDENSNAGNEIVVTYTVKVTETTVENTAQGHAGGSHFDSTTVEVYTGQITLTKYDEESNVLGGAGFEVYNATVVDESVTPTGAALKFIPTSTVVEDESGNMVATVADGDYTYAPDATDGYTTEVFTKADGTVIIRGLDVGTYYFKETTAPEGYSINTEGTSATLQLTAGTTEATAILTARTNIHDTKLNALPSTGGIGTTIFTIGGVAIMVVAAGLFIATRKKSSK